MTEYIKNSLSGRLKGVTYEDGKIIDVHIRDTDDVVKVFVPVRHGRWIDAYPDIEPNLMFMYGICSECGFEQGISKYLNYCPNCGAKMSDDGELKEGVN